MDLQLKGKKAFISGSTSGIGFAIGRALAAEGAVVFLNGRQQVGVDEAVFRLQQELPEAEIQGMVCDFKAWNPSSDFLEKVQNMDILVNNVGIYSSVPFEQTTEQMWQDMLEVNLLSAARLSKIALPQMLKKNDGRIIMISSECAELVPEDLIGYSVTKAALHALSRGLAQRTKGTAVTVNTVMPGSTMTEGPKSFWSNKPPKRDKRPKPWPRTFLKVKEALLCSDVLPPLRKSPTRSYTWRVP